uniref:Serine protease easter n=1 Tax=Cacopsylla melanoneura TaxID=428564 RepID=A0A8D8WIX8_9HEMI
MRRVELFFVFLVEYCFIDGLSGLNWKQDDGFNPEEHENYKLLPPKNSCGTNGLGTQTESEKIVGGYETKLGEIPWIVQYGEKPNGTFQLVCGGNLISERYVLLAAHCINASLNPERFTVRLGEWNITGDPDSQGDLHAPPVQDIKVAEYITHENYNSTKVATRNDIALIRLETTATLGFFVQPVCLPYGAAMSKDFTSEDTLAAGWGITNSSKPFPLPTILQAIKLTVADAAKCTEAYSNILIEVNYNDGQICVGGEEGKDACSGDSGGPLLWKGSFEPDITERTYVLGLGSLVADETCVLKGFPGVFTRTNFFMKWILDNMRA